MLKSKVVQSGQTDRKILTGENMVSIVNFSVQYAVFLFHYACLALSVTWQERLDLDGKTCSPKDRNFERVTPSLIGCLYHCGDKWNCIGVSYNEITHVCMGCICRTLRISNGPISQTGSKFYARDIQSLFGGKCGRTYYENITGEYYPKGGSVGPVTPPISLHNDESWRPQRKKSYTLKIDFGYQRLVYAVRLQGKIYEGFEEYVTRFILYESDSKCEDKTEIEEFLGIKDVSNTKKVTLQPPVLTRCIFLRPTDWVIRPSLRIDIYGY